MTKNLRFVPSMFFAFLLGCSVVNVGGNAEDYFPMETGNTWVYEVKTQALVDTVSFSIFESGPGLFEWGLPGDGQAILSADISDGSDPFDDSVVSVVDSAFLLWAGANLSIPLDPEKLNKLSVGLLKTKYGVFDDCIFIVGTPDTKGVSFNVWLARGIGPVKIEEWVGDLMAKEFQLLEFYSVK